MGVSCLDWRPSIARWEAIDAASCNDHTRLTQWCNSDFRLALELLRKLISWPNLVDSWEVGSTTPGCRCRFRAVFMAAEFMRVREKA